MARPTTRTIKHILTPIFISAAAVLFMAPKYDLSGIKTFSLVPRSGLTNIKIMTLPDGKEYYTVDDLSYERNPLPLATDLILSFNTEARALKRDDTRKYLVTAADYTASKGDGALGAGSAQFYKREHGVTIKSSQGLWLGSCDDLGSFTIECRLRLSALADGGTIFSRMGYLSGSRRGIEIAVKDGRVVADLTALFERPDGRRQSYTLGRTRALKPGIWYHYSLSFNRSSGKLATAINGSEEEVVYATESGEPYNGVYVPLYSTRNADGGVSCPDAFPTTIGKGFRGFLDEFRIAYRAVGYLERRSGMAYKRHTPVDAAGRIPLNVGGTVTSPVYEFPLTGTRVTLFRWDEHLEKNTFVWMQFRISDTKFAESDMTLPWYRVDNNQKKIYLTKDAQGTYLRGKYYQWRAHLIPSPDGKRSPRVSGVEAHYWLDAPPNPPLFLEVASIADRSIVLRWKKNVDADIGGYRIYYGTRPGRYDGIITTIGGKRITNDLAKGNTCEVTITNDIINENHSADTRQILTYPLINNTVLYYFAVSAYDSYKIGTPWNHESDPSKPVTARPYPGSQIDQKIR